jgi:hypothetical protein
VKTVGMTPPVRSEPRCERLADDALVVHLAENWTIHIRSQPSRANGRACALALSAGACQASLGES